MYKGGCACEGEEGGGEGGGLRGKYLSFSDCFAKMILMFCSKIGMSVLTVSHTTS